MKSEPRKNSRPAPEPRNGPATPGEIESARAEFLALMERLESDPEHALHVTRLSLQLFDELAELHQLGARERLWLEAAACLHDAGWSVAPDGSKHHKHSADLIRKQPWRCFNPAEVELVAQVARYHRKSMPKLSHEAFAALRPRDQERVRRLAALLRVADGLDRSHRQCVNELAVRIEPERLVVQLRTRAAPEPELSAAEMKSDLAQAVFHREVTFENQSAERTPRMAPRAVQFAR